MSKRHTPAKHRPMAGIKRRTGSAGLAGLVAALWWLMPAEAATPPGSDLVRITLNFLRTRATPQQDPVRLVPQSCPVCVQSDDPRYARENARQTIVALDVPRGRSIEPEFTADAGGFDRVILQTEDVPLQVQGLRLRVQLPPVLAEATEAGEFATNIVGVGYVLRFEHADPERRFGAYAKGLPVRQRRAADTLEFAFREAMLELDLGEQVAREAIGIIEIMGFDTNAPHGHTDAPPHVHMHLRWPYNTGTQIGHFYLGDDGRIVRNQVGIAGLHAPERTYQPGMPFDTIGPKGEPVYRQQIAADGGLTLSLPDGSACRIGAPLDDFSVEIHVACSGHEPVVIHVQDDLAAGDLIVRRIARHASLIEHFRYDPRTGSLLSPSQPPALEASAVIPIIQGPMLVPLPASRSSK